MRYEVSILYLTLSGKKESRICRIFPGGCANLTTVGRITKAAPFFFGSSGSQSVLRPFMALFLARYNRLLKANPLIVTSLTTGFCYGLGDFIAQTIEIKQEQSSSYNSYRLGVMGIYGIFLGGPVYYVWFSRIERIPQLLEKLVSWNEKRTLVAHFSRELGERINSNNIIDMSMKAFRNSYKANFEVIDKPIIRSKTILVAKIYADQFLFSPLYIGYFLLSTGLMMDLPSYNMKQPLYSQFKRSYLKTWENIKKKFVNIYVADCAVWPLAQMANFAFVPSHLQPIFVNVVNVAWNSYLSYASQGH
jgi:hypothetical protein